MHNKRKHYGVIIMLLAIILLISGIIIAIMHHHQQINVNIAYHRWQQQVSPQPQLNLTTIVKRSNDYPTATIIYSPNCHMCRQLSQNLPKHAQLPFNVVAVPKLQPNSNLWPNQLSIDHTPALVVWRYQLPQLVIVQPTATQLQAQLNHYHADMLARGSYDYINNLTHTTSIASVANDFKIN